MAILLPRGLGGRSADLWKPRCAQEAESHRTYTLNGAVVACRRRSGLPRYSPALVPWSPAQRSYTEMVTSGACVLGSLVRQLGPEAVIRCIIAGARQRGRCGSR